MNIPLTYDEFVGFKLRNPNIEWSKAYQGVYVKDSILGYVLVYQKPNGEFTYTKVSAQTASNAGESITDSWWNTFWTTFQTEFKTRSESLIKTTGISLGVLSLFAIIVLFLIYAPRRG